MTAKTLEEEAREAAERWYPPGAGRLGGKLYAGKPAKEGFRERSSFQHGFLSAATLRDKEIEELRAKLASMREPIWMLREEHEREIEKLLARVKELEGMVKFRDDFMRERYRQAFADCFPPIPLPGEGG